MLPSSPYQHSRSEAEGQTALAQKMDSAHKINTEQKARLPISPCNDPESLWEEMGVYFSGPQICNGCNAKLSTQISAALTVPSFKKIKFIIRLSFNSGGCHGNQVGHVLYL